MKSLYLVAPQDEGLLEGNPQSLLYLMHWVTTQGACDYVKIINSVDDIMQPGKNDEVYLGVSVTSATYQAGLRFAKRVKASYPQIKVIFGGYHTKGLGRVILANHPEIDYVVEGPGEKALVNILNGMQPGLVRGIPLSQKEWDSILVDDIVSLDPEFFSNAVQFKRANYISSLGCTTVCSFCASAGVLRAKSVSTILKDLETMYMYGYTSVSFQDNYFAYDMAKVKQLCALLTRKPFKLDLDCQSRVESLQDAELLYLMKKAGFTRVYIGVENL